MAPESMAAMLQLSQPDPQLMEYVSRSLLLSSRYSSEAGDSSIAALRREQAYAVARAFGVDLDESSISQQELDALFERSGLDPRALGVTAVSYTHLDVYKRQVEFCETLGDVVAIRFVGNKIV